MKKQRPPAPPLAARPLPWGTLLPALAILIAALIAFFPAFGGDWLWDDNTQVTENGALHTLSGLRNIWFNTPEVDYLPLKSTFLWIAWHLWGDTPLGYHLSGFACHLVSAFLLWKGLGRLGLRYGWIGGLLFAIHPLTVESVSWISELKNTLSLPLFLLSLDAYIEFDGEKRKRKKGAYVLALLCYLAALLTKASVIMLPPVLLLFVWWKRGRIGGRDIARILPFFALAALFACVTISFQNARAIGGDTVLIGGLPSRFACAGLASVFYLWKFLLPLSLFPVYPRWTIDPPTLAQFLPDLALLGLLLWFWTRRKTWGRHALFGLGFFLLTLLPVAGFLQMYYMRYSWVADHFVYLPMIGLAGLAAAGAEALWTRFTSPLQHRCLRDAGAILAVLLLIGSTLHAAVYHDLVAMWSYGLKGNPGFAVAHNDLGVGLVQRGKLEEAFAHFDQAVRLDPNYADAWSNLGYMFLGAGKLKEAMIPLGEALRINPNLANAHANLGYSLLYQGRSAEAAREFIQALRIRPYYPEARQGLEAARAGRTAMPPAK